MICVGTSGWSYDDWAGAFYPPSLPKQAWLSYYGRFFRTTEINSTYYTFPAPFVVHEWIRKGMLVNGFEFSLKMPGRVTHDSLMADVDTALDFEEKVVTPIKDAGLLGAVLIQTSPYLHYPDHFERLETMLESLDTESVDYAIELRHRSWLRGGNTLPEVSRLLIKHEVSLCAADGPSTAPKAAIEHTGRHTYIRFHGRNDDLWFGGKDLDGRMNRYDYSYSREELEPWKATARSIPGVVRAYFNNHPRANAAKNAKLFETMLGVEKKETLPPRRQTGLSQFFDDRD
ncbi:MAG TPA: DUF72 domain-containing protein [Methanocella sp.]|nr:DUF72 domain-containing protein [Methanocella sp.]